MIIELVSYAARGDKKAGKAALFSEHFVGLKGTNPRTCPILLSSWGFELPNADYITQIPTDGPDPVSFPLTLMPGESVTVAKKYMTLAQEIRSAGFPESVLLTGFFQERNRTRHKTESFPFSRMAVSGYSSGTICPGAQDPCPPSLIRGSL